MRRGVWLAVLVAACVGSASGSAHPYSFLTQPTDQLGVPGYAPGTLITPTGSLYTGWVELAFRVGPQLEPTDATARDLLDGRSPVIRYYLSASGINYTVTVFSVALGHRPVNFVRVVWHNGGRRPAEAGWGAGLLYSAGGATDGSTGQFRFTRPATPSRVGGYDQPGATFDPDSVWAFSGNSVLRDGRALLLFPPAPHGVTRRLTLRPEGPSGPIEESTEFGEVDYRATVAPGKSGELDFAMPVIPVAPTSRDYPTIVRASLRNELSQDLAYWHGLFDSAVQIHVPEAKVEDTFYTSLANMDEPRYPAASGGWVQAVNKLQYNAFWLRDASIIANAFDLTGLHDIAAEDLDFFPSWQQTDGLFISNPSQYDGFGEALWAIGEHATLTGDRSFAMRMLTPIERAMGWFEHEQASEPLGLMPLSSPGDDELTTGHLTGDNFWAADGISAAIGLARLLGRTTLVQRWTADLQAFESRLRTELSHAEAITGGWIPPTLEGAGGEDWGNLWASYPGPVLPPDAPAVTATLTHAISHFREGIETYLDGTYLHDYLAFRVFETELLRGQQGAVVNGLYAELAHTTATNGGFEVGIAAGTARVLPVDLAPHGWFAAEYVALLRNMLVRTDGSTVFLMSAVSPRWLLPGRQIAVSGADTGRGRLSFTLRAVRGGAVLTWQSTLAPGTRLRWPVPAAGGDIEATGLSPDRRTIALPGPAGRLRVHWHLSGPFPSFAATARWVAAQYPAQ